MHAVACGGIDFVEHFGGAVKRLGRDTAVVEANAADALALDQRGLFAELGSADGRDVAARPAADDDKVILLHDANSPPGKRDGIFCIKRA